MSFRIIEHPWLGWGLGSSSSLPFKEPHGALYMFTDKPAAHPHNVMTQLWAELGLPGLAIGLAFAFLMLRKISRLDPRLAPFALGAWVACFCLSLTAYDFWTDSLFAAFALTGLAFAILQKQINAFQPWMAAPKARR
jgi:O-antigen ligase